MEASWRMLDSDIDIIEHNQMPWKIAKQGFLWNNGE
jgi:hypothetical protein